MVQVILTSGASIVYNYDHEGKRIGKTMDGTTKDYYFDGDDLIIEAQGENILAYYTQGQGLISQRRNNASYFYHYDGLGSTKALTDANQNIQSTTIYDAWGNILQASGAITNPFLYLGASNWYAEFGIDSSVLYLSANTVLSTSTFYNPAIARSTTSKRPRTFPFPIDWEHGGYGPWPNWPGEDPYDIPIFPNPRTCQGKAWNVYINCLRGKYSNCKQSCAFLVAALMGKRVDLQIPSPLPTPPSSAAVVQPWPPKPIPSNWGEVLMNLIELVSNSFQYRLCLGQCMNSEGPWEFPILLKTDKIEWWKFNLPNCFAEGRDFYKQCCEGSK
ncbi:hypothetical protein H5T88_05180 [bacterium]|nr:hypothetical protein [bacterium]